MDIIDDIKTVDGVANFSDPLVNKQREDVSKMRTSLLACDIGSPAAAIQNITVLRIYHQIARIIRYIDMMDRIEDKLYESIDCQLATLDPTDEATWMKLITLQAKLQNNMLISHKLLEPYIDKLDEIKGFVELSAQPVYNDANNILDKESRESLRTAAQSVLAMLPPSGGS